MAVTHEDDLELLEVHPDGRWVTIEEVAQEGFEDIAAATTGPDHLWFEFVALTKRDDGYLLEVTSGESDRVWRSVFQGDDRLFITPPLKVELTEPVMADPPFPEPTLLELADIEELVAEGLRNPLSQTDRERLWLKIFRKIEQSSPEDAEALRKALRDDGLDV